MSEDPDLSNDQKLSRSRWGDSNPLGSGAAASGGNSKSSAKNTRSSARSSCSINKPKEGEASMPPVVDAVGARSRAHRLGIVSSSRSASSSGGHQLMSSSHKAPGKLASPASKGLSRGGKVKVLEDKPVTFHKKVKSSGYGYIQPKVELGKSKPAAVKVLRQGLASSVVILCRARCCE
jgi:hypothetical protein